MKNRKISRLEFSLWILVIVIAILLLLIYQMTAKKGNYVQVRVSGELVAEYSLEEDGRYLIDGIKNGSNTLVIEGGEAYMKEADCPDKLCVKQGKISRIGDSLICLPHQVIVEVVSKEDRQQSDDVDAVVK